MLYNLILRRVIDQSDYRLKSLSIADRCLPIRRPCCQVAGHMTRTSARRYGVKQFKMRINTNYSRSLDNDQDKCLEQRFRKQPKVSRDVPNNMAPGYRQLCWPRYFLKESRYRYQILAKNVSRYRPQIHFIKVSRYQILTKVSRYFLRYLQIRFFPTYFCDSFHQKYFRIMNW